VADLNHSKKKRKKKILYQQHIHLKNRSHAHTHTLQTHRSFTKETNIYGWINHFQQVSIEMMIGYGYHLIPLIHLLMDHYLLLLLFVEEVFELVLM